MADLPRAAFALVALAAFLLRYLLAQRGDRRSRRLASDPTRTSVPVWRSGTALLAYAASAIAMILYFTHIHYTSDPIVILHAPSILRHTGVLPSILLGVICGVLVFDFYQFLNRSDSPSTISVVARLLPIAAVFLLGLFQSDVKSVLDRMQRLETPLGTMEFSRPPDQEEDAPFLLEKVLQPSSTDFQMGTQAAKHAMQSAQRDLENLVNFCGIPNGPICNPQVTTHAPLIYERHDPAQELLHAMHRTYGYATSFSALTSCLDAYAGEYENGVPIQDDLSEIAASYITIRSADPQVKAVESNFDDSYYINQILSVNDRILQMRLDMMKDASQKYDDLQLEQEVRNLHREIIDPDHVVARLGRLVRHLRAFAERGGNSACRDLPDWRALAEHHDEMIRGDFVLPYRAMLVAAFLTAAGYPAEGAGHLEREYEVFLEQFGPGDGSDLVEFVLRIRMLHALQDSFDYAGERERALRYHEQARSLSKLYLKRLLRTKTSEVKELLDRCIEQMSRTEDGGGREKNEFASSLKSGIRVSAREGDRETEWSEYVARLVHFVLNNEFLWLERIAWQERDLTTDIELNEGKELWNIAVESPYLIGDCLSEARYWEPAVFSAVRFQMAYHFGLVHAQKSARLSQAAAVAGVGGELDGFDVDRSRRLACAGALGLRRAHMIGQEVPVESDWYKVVNQKLLETERMLRVLARADCS